MYRQAWPDKELFEKLPISIADAQALIHKAFAKRQIQRYPWGFRKLGQVSTPQIWRKVVTDIVEFVQSRLSSHIFSAI